MIYGSSKNNYTKQQLYSYKMDESKSLEENIDEFSKPLTNLENLQIEVDSEDKTVLLLNSLPQTYHQLKDTLKYAIDTLAFDEVVSGACSKELDLNNSRKISRSIDEGFIVRGKIFKIFDRERTSERSDHSKKISIQRKFLFKSKPKKTCWICQKKVTLKSTVLSKMHEIINCLTIILD